MRARTVHWQTLVPTPPNCRGSLNAIVGPNNVGKTVVIDALRVLLSASDEGNLRLSELDLHQTATGELSLAATFTFVFSGLLEENEADFMTALIPIKNAAGAIVGYHAQFNVQYTQAEQGGRLRLRRWAGLHEENVMTTLSMCLSSVDLLNGSQATSRTSRDSPGPEARHERQFSGDEIESA